MTKTHWILTAVFGVAVLYFLVFANPTPLGKTLPDFNLQTTDQTPFTNQDLKGKNTLIYFYGEGCPSCRVVGPIVDKLAEDYHPQKLQVVAAEVWNDTPAQAARLKKRNQAEYTFVSGATPLSQKLEIKGVPTVYLVNPEGKVVAVAEGYNPSEPLDQIVKTTFNL